MYSIINIRLGKSRPVVDVVNSFEMSYGLHYTLSMPLIIHHCMMKVYIERLIKYQFSMDKLNICYRCCIFVGISVCSIVSVICPINTVMFFIT